MVGKFDPPHTGHRLLIETALALSDCLTVVVCHKPGQRIPASKRQEWLARLYPMATVLLLDQTTFNDQSEAEWAAAIIALVGSVDCYFTSENYGERYARLLGSSHHLVDQARLKQPVSSTFLKEHPLMAAEFLDPEIREEVLPFL